MRSPTSTVQESFLVTSNDEKLDSMIKIVYSCHSHESDRLINNIRLERSSFALECSESCLKFNIEGCGWIYIGSSNFDLTFDFDGQKLSKIKSTVDLDIRYSSDSSSSE